MRIKILLQITGDDGAAAVAEEVGVTTRSVQNCTLSSSPVGWRSGYHAQRQLLSARTPYFCLASSAVRQVNCGGPPPCNSPRG